jgi:hypothetical protein
LIFLFQKDKILDAQLPESAADLEKRYKKAKEDLKAKLSRAKSLSEKISKLKSGTDFLLQNDLRQLDIEMGIQTSLINNSSFAESEIKMLEERIETIKSSGIVVSLQEKVKIRYKIAAMQDSIDRARLIQEEILITEQDSGFCSQAVIEKLKKDLHSVQNVLKKLQPLSTG